MIRPPLKLKDRKCSLFSPVYQSQSLLFRNENIAKLAIEEGQHIPILLYSDYYKSEENSNFSFLKEVKRNPKLKQSWQKGPLVFKKLATSMINIFTIKDLYSWIHEREMLEIEERERESMRDNSKSEAAIDTSSAVLESLGLVYSEKTTGWIMSTLSHTNFNNLDTHLGDGVQENAIRSSVEIRDIYWEQEGKHHTDEKEMLNSMTGKIDKILYSSKNETIVFNDAGIVDGAPQLFRNFCREALKTFCYPVSLNVYITGAEKVQSAPPHSDYQDIFIIQVEGRKRWKIFSPVVNGKPTDKNINVFARGKYDEKLNINTESDEIYQVLITSSGKEDELSYVDPNFDSFSKIDEVLDSSLLLDIVLEPGDCIYVPAGFIHTTSTSNLYGESEIASINLAPSIHFTLGIDTHIWGLSYANLRDIIIANIVYRSEKETKTGAKNQQTVGTLRSNTDDIDRQKNLKSLKFPSATRYNHLNSNLFFMIHKSLFGGEYSTHNQLMETVSTDSSIPAPSSSPSLFLDDVQDSEKLKEQIKTTLLHIDHALREYDTQFQQDPKLNEDFAISIIDSKIDDMIIHYQEIMRTFDEAYSEKESDQCSEKNQIINSSHPDEKTFNCSPFEKLSNKMNDFTLAGYPHLKDKIRRQLKREKDNAIEEGGKLVT